MKGKGAAALARLPKLLIVLTLASSIGLHWMSRSPSYGFKDAENLT